MASGEMTENGNAAACNSDKEVTVGEALELAGGAGAFQWTYLVALGIPWIVWSMITCESVFVRQTPTWHLTGNATQAGEPAAADQCGLAADAWTWDSPETSIIAEFFLICDGKARSPLLTSLFFFGFMLGLPVGGTWSDSRGRKEACLGGLAILHIPAVLSFTAPNYTVYAAARFLFGFGNAIFAMSAFVWVTEMLGDAMSSVTVGWMNSMFAVGQMLLSPLAYFLPQWRHLCTAVAVATVLVATYMWTLMESPKWLASQGRFADANRVLRRIAKANKQPTPPGVKGAAGQTDGKSPKRAQAKQHGFCTLLDQRLLCRFLISCATWFTASSSFYGLALNAGHLPLSIYMSNFIGGVIQVPAYVGAGCLIQAPWCGRKGAVILGFLLGGSSLLLSALTHQKTALLVFYYLGSFGVSISFAVVFLFAAELFPTNVRSLGLSVTSVFARLGAMISPFIASLGEVSPALPLIIFGVPCLVTGVLQVLLPETRGTQLPDTLDDIRPKGSACDVAEIDSSSTESNSENSSDEADP